MNPTADNHATPAALKAIDTSFAALAKADDLARIHENLTYIEAAIAEDTELSMAWVSDVLAEARAAGLMQPPGQLGCNLPPPVNYSHWF